ncbi:hypothetical protein PENANT_c012G04603 [Penicillium antarcticum]|uniref:Zn(2)-C6 fungal-type domain-containing protein n=1 Tax=Penicillium antarcticum TaxID=416450 RepID=A0A1V6Q643_9EURO|nr:uncharacterized protein N7508_008194 [Penicillium antarcticum]KAJ5297945.1 hypothetical protein N7508_008194 [Penicillium antarcticum]OQD84735.1 hypothetical protein PENANT_c012G04603 [Penicillium antarcticum]
MSLMAETDGGAPGSDNQATSDQKRHAACDECRKRKLKCSGELSGCARCLKQSLHCNYSSQKQMGRPPKKRARTDDEGLEPTPPGEIWPSPEDSQQSSVGPSFTNGAFPDSDHLCPLFFWTPGGNSPQSQPTSDLLPGEEEHNHAWRPDRLKPANLPVFPSSSPWPDFSTVSEATAMPFPVPNLQGMDSLPLSPPTSVSSDGTITGCTCLSYLYLCLSHISSLASFPVNSHTLCSLYIAARTAQDVIRCQECPKVFATGMQNTMFVGTLLTVVADAWLRVSKADAVELGKQSASPEYVAQVQQSPDPTQAWKSWLHQIVRRAIIGGTLDHGAVVGCSGQLDLLSLIKEVEHRQWLRHQPHNSQSPCSSSAIHNIPPEYEQQEKEHLCLRVVGSARHVISKFNFDPSDYPEGVEPVTFRDKMGE